MIIFQTDHIRIDLSGYGVTLNEENSLFSDNIYRSYSLPFSVRADDELWVKLGLPSLDNVTNVEAKISGKLLLPNRYYNAVLYLGEIEGDAIECSLTYGDEELPVYEMELKDLPWPIILSPDLLNFANEVKDKHWPEVGFNFPMIYNPSIREISNYEHFRGFINNYSSSGYTKNISLEGPEGMEYFNYNVMAPTPYLLEILQFGFSLEGKTITGPAVEDDILRKTVYIPETYLERFRGSEFQSFSFSTPDEVLQDNLTYGIHRRQFTLERTGSYNLEFDLNLDPVLAADFELSIDQVAPNGNSVNLFRAHSRNNRVKMEEELQVNVTDADLFHEIVISLQVTGIEDISANNRFEFSSKDGQLNEHPSYFTLGNFMPEMTFGEFVNELKNWLNLDIVITDNEVTINFAQESVLEKPREDHRHLEISEPKKKHNTNRFYKLSYANSEKIYYNKNGQVYSNLDEKGDEVVELEMDVQPATVEQNENVLTAVMPEDRAGIDFAVYSGMIGGKPVCDPVLHRELLLQSVFRRHWETWLRYRVDSKTFRETFECSVHEPISIEALSMKYNELHLIKKLNKKFLNENVMRVEVESETF